MKYYTGIGSRETPKEISQIMSDLAFKLSQEGWILRSGGAQGADTAFEEGATNSFAEHSPEIYLPWITFNNHDSMSCGAIVPNKFDNWSEATKMAKSIHPAWDRLSPAAKTLHTRNCYQVLGKDLSTPSKFLVCYAEPLKDGSVKGGTRTAVVLAQQHDIPVLNLWHNDIQSRIEIYLEG